MKQLKIFISFFILLYASSKSTVNASNNTIRLVHDSINYSVRIELLKDTVVIDSYYIPNIVDHSDTLFKIGDDKYLYVFQPCNYCEPSIFTTIQLVFTATKNRLILSLALDRQYATGNQLAYYKSISINDSAIYYVYNEISLDSLSKYLIYSVSSKKNQNGIFYSISRKIVHVNYNKEFNIYYNKIVILNGIYKISFNNFSNSISKKFISKKIYSLEIDDILNYSFIDGNWYYVLLGKELIELKSSFSNCLFGCSKEY